MEIVYSDGQESSRVIGDVPDCEVTIGNSTVRFAMLVMEGLTRPIVGHDVIASLDLTINARARVLVPTSPTLLRQLRQAQQRSGASMAEGVASRPYTPFRASPRDRDIYRHGRVTELRPVSKGQREKVRRALRRRQAGSTVSPKRQSDTRSTASPGPSRAVSSSPATSVVREVPPVFRSAEEEEWFYETRDMQVDHREYPDYEEEAATMVRVLGHEKHVVKPLPQPQPRTIPGLQLGTVAVNSVRRRILPQVVTAVKFDVPAGATGVLEVRLHPGYAHLNLEVVMGIVDTRHSTMKVPVLNRSDIAQVLDEGVPLIEVWASDFVVLDDIDYDSESGEEPARPSEVRMAAFEASTEPTYTEAERVALQRATPEDRQRWCDTLAQYKHVDNRYGREDMASAPNSPSQRREQLEIKRHRARGAIARVQQRNKKRLDRHRRDVSYNTGDRVLLFNPIRKLQPWGKFRPRYTGPLRIAKRHGAVNYLVASRHHPKPKLVHVRRLKPFYTRAGLEEQEATTEGDTDHSEAEDEATVLESSATEEYFGPEVEREVLGKRPVRPPRHLQDYTW